MLFFHSYCVKKIYQASSRYVHTGWLIKCWEKCVNNYYIEELLVRLHTLAKVISVQSTNS